MNKVNFVVGVALTSHFAMTSAFELGYRHNLGRGAIFFVLAAVTGVIVVTDDETWEAWK